MPDIFFHARSLAPDWHAIRFGNRAKRAAQVVDSDGSVAYTFIMQPMLAQIYDGRSPRGHWVSEKFRGIRATWDGCTLATREGHRLHAPPSFTDGFPSMALDGELWMGYGSTEHDVWSIAGSRSADSRAWHELVLMVFDAPVSGPVESRMKALESLSFPAHVQLATHHRCRGRSHLAALYTDVVARGGEGVMLRRPRADYEQCRSDALLKMKHGEGA